MDERRSVAVEQLETQLFRAVAQLLAESPLAVQEQLSMISSSASQT